MKKTILVIEDNRDNLELVRQILEDAGYRIASATLADEGIKMLRNGGIDLVLMDIALPEMDGLEATRLIRSDPDLQDASVIVLSARAMTSDREMAIEAGCDAYLTKPVDVNLLLETIRDWIG